ncbi:MAG: hypothetical protein ACI90M_004816, partial [Candidatus Azotimanducaceae bacterium]
NAFAYSTALPLGSTLAGVVNANVLDSCLAPYRTVQIR